MQFDDFENALEPSGGPGETEKSSPRRLIGPLISAAGFIGILLEVTDLMFDWAKLDRFATPMVVFGTSFFFLLLGSMVSRVVGSPDSQRNSRALFFGATAVIGLVAVFLCLAIGAVVYFFWVIAEK